MKRMILFIVITFSISWFCWGINILAQQEIIPSGFQLVGQFGLFGPFFAFMIMNRYDKVPQKIAFKKLFLKVELKWILFAILSPMILSLGAYLIHLQYSGESFSFGVTWISFIPTALFILVVGGPVEEFGWRGYLLPLMRQKYSFVVTALLLGLIHALWHLPLHFTEGTVQEAIPIWEFWAITIVTCISYVFIYEYTHSLYPMIVLHWFGNLSSAMFGYFYSQEGRYALFIGTVLLDIILLYLVSKKHKEVTA